MNSSRFVRGDRTFLGLRLGQYSQKPLRRFANDFVFDIGCSSDSLPDLQLRAVVMVFVTRSIPLAKIRMRKTWGAKEGL